MKLIVGLLPLILISSVSGSGRAQTGADVFTVTDATGHTEKLSSLFLEHTESYQSKPSGYLDVMLRKRPVRMAWIEWIHSEIAVFTRAEGSVHVAVKTTDGQSVQRQFFEPIAGLALGREEARWAPCHGEKGPNAGGQDYASYLCLP